MVKGGILFVVMQLCLIPTQPTVSAGHSLLNFMEKILEGMMVQLFVEVGCGGGGGAAGKHKQSSKMKHTHSLTKHNWEFTRHIIMADTNLQMSLLSLIRQLSSHTRRPNVWRPPMFGDLHLHLQSWEGSWSGREIFFFA